MFLIAVCEELRSCFDGAYNVEFRNVITVKESWMMHYWPAAEVVKAKAVFSAGKLTMIFFFEA